MHVIIQQERLGTEPAEARIDLTNGFKAVSLHLIPSGYITLSPADAEALAYDLLCKAYNVRHGIHDNRDREARGMYAGKEDLTEVECLAGLGFDFREEGEE